MTHRTSGTLAVHGALLLCAALLASACDHDGNRAGNPFAPSSGAGVSGIRSGPGPTPAPDPAPTPEPPSPGPGPDPSPGPTPTPTPPVTARLMEMLELSIRDEYRARYTYWGVVTDFGDRTPFSNIVEAEAQHIDAVSRLFASRGLDVPPSEYTLDNVPRFSTFTEACQAGVAGETRNWQMYSGFLTELQEAGTLPQDVQTVFTSLMEASRDKHLPAFEKCAT